MSVLSYGMGGALEGHGPCVLARSRSWFFTGILLVLAFVQLNLQKVLYVALDLPLDETASHPALLIWTIAPVSLWLYAGLQILRRTGVRKIEIPLLLWLYIVVAHAVYFLLAKGAGFGMLAFMAWAAWVGLVFRFGRHRDLAFPYFIAVLFASAAVINGFAVLYEELWDVELFKMVTLGGVVRRYGLSQSVSILGLQLAIGCIAILYLIKQHGARRSIVLALICLFALVAAALVISSSRGAVIFLMAALGYLIWSWTSFPITRVVVVLMVTLLGTVLAAAVVANLLNWPYVEFIASSLSISDEGNVARLSLYREALAYLTRDGLAFLLGDGSGSLSIMAVRLGGAEFGIESSLLKLFLEFGVAGAAPLLFFVAIVVARGARAQFRYKCPFLAPFVAMALVLLLQASIHESLQSWLVQFYFWSILVAIMVLSNRAITLAQAGYRVPLGARASKPTEHNALC